MEKSETMAIYHFLLWQSQVEPHFHEIDKLMSSYWKQLPTKEALRIANVLKRTVVTFSDAEGIGLQAGDSRVVEKYYWKCRRAYLSEIENLPQSLAG